jgi:predicted glycoside hydrolase/deacetylase ChbG (UPF0249 family)
MLKRLSVIIWLCVLATTLASAVVAQVTGQPYRLTDKDVEKIIRRIEQQSDRFRSGLDAALDKSRFNGTNREDDINAFVKDFYEKTKTLHDHFDHHKSAAPDVQAVLERAVRVDGFMRRYPLSPRAQDDWSTLKTNLDELAAAYEVSWRWSDYSGGYPQEQRGRPYGTVTNPIVVSDVPYRVSDREVEQTLRRIENQSDKFRSTLDAALDKSRFDGTRREDDINAFVKDFYSQVKTLHDHFDGHKSTNADVQSVLDRASRIDEFMSRTRLKKQNAQKEWAKLKVNLDELARVYNVSWRWGY